MTELRMNKFNEDNSLINRKNIFVPTAAVSADGKVMNTKINFASQDSGESIDDCEFYLPKYLNATTLNLSEFKSKIENDIFNEDILSSSNAFRLILMWLFTHVYPKMSELADKNLKLSNESAIEAFKNFTQLSSISLESFKNAYEKEISSANYQLISSLTEVFAGVVQIGLDVRNQSKNGGYKIDKEKLEQQKSFKDAFMNEHNKYEAEYKDRNERYLNKNNENDYALIRDKEESEITKNNKKIFKGLRDIDENKISHLDNGKLLKHIEGVHNENIKVLKREGMIDPKTNLLKECDNPKMLSDKELVRRRNILARLKEQYNHTLNDDKVVRDKLGNLDIYFKGKEIAYQVAELYSKAVGHYGTAGKASIATISSYKFADSKYTADRNKVFMDMYTQENSNKVAQIEGLKNVYKEAFDLLAKYLENYFNAANASNLQR